MSLRVVDIDGLGGNLAAGVAQLGQRRWDEVPVRNGSQVQILPSALSKKSSKATAEKTNHHSSLRREAKIPATIAVMVPNAPSAGNSSSSSLDT